jgi:hypothetical protein
MYLKMIARPPVISPRSVSQPKMLPMGSALPLCRRTLGQAAGAARNDRAARGPRRPVNWNQRGARFLAMGLV